MKHLKTLRHQMRHPTNRKKHGPNTVSATVVLRKDFLGRLTFKLPGTRAKDKVWEVGSKAWFATKGQNIVLTVQPWGPYPRKGRRAISRVRRIPAKTMPVRKSPWPRL
jgi:hypothetical protein